MTWPENSIMHSRGVAGGKIINTHELTEKRQGRFQYTIGPYSDPVLQVAPGDRVVIETVDTFEGKIRTERDLPTQKLHAPFLNPQCGPIMMEDASKGEVLAISSAVAVNATVIQPPNGMILRIGQRPKPAVQLTFLNFAANSMPPVCCEVNAHPSSSSPKIFWKNP